MSSEIILNCFDRGILLETHDESILDYFKKDYFVRESIPMYSTSQTGKYQARITYTDSGERKAVFDIDNKALELRIPKKKLYLPDIVYSAIDLFSRIHEENDRSMIHCSAVADENNNGIIFIGDAGSGKTSIALKLCLNNRFYFCSNDRTLVEYKKGSAVLLGGTKEIDMRISSIQKQFPEFRFLLPEHINDPWREKVILTPEVLNKAGVRFKSGAEVKRFYFVWVHPFPSHFKKRLLSPYEALSKHFFFSSQYIRGNGRLITSLDMPVPSLDTMNLSKRRLERLRGIAENTRTFELFGELGLLQKSILEGG